jgi:hypothetical protein
MSSRRIDRGKVARGGAPTRTCPSRASTFVHEAGLAVGRVLDYGCVTAHLVCARTAALRSTLYCVAGCLRNGATAAHRRM